MRNTIQSITKPASPPESLEVARAASDVKRISGLISEKTRSFLKVFLENSVLDAVSHLHRLASGIKVRHRYELRLRSHAPGPHGDGSGV